MDAAGALPPAVPDWLAPRFDAMPEELTRVPRWVLWGRKPKPGEKVSKAPLMPNGRHASPTDPTTWSTFDECRRAFERGGFTGVGFVLDGKPRDDGRILIGIDVDKVTTASVRIPELQALLDSTYCEESPSGTGLRAFVWADRAITTVLQARDGWPGVEIYTTDRYLTVTGHQIANGGANG
jgi:primase-polymerase (primpol)-like protein